MLANLWQLSKAWLDLTLLHGPCELAGLHGSQATAANAAQWEGLQRALDLGLTRSIGVSNFDSAKLHRLMLGPSTWVAPAGNQCQMSINGTIMHVNGALISSGGHDDATLSYCQAHSIT